MREGEKGMKQMGCEGNGAHLNKEREGERVDETTSFSLEKLIYLYLIINPS